MPRAANCRSADLLRKLHCSSCSQPFLSYLVIDADVNNGRIWVFPYQKRARDYTCRRLLRIFLPQPGQALSGPQVLSEPQFLGELRFTPRSERVQNVGSPRVILLLCQALPVSHVSWMSQSPREFGGHGRATGRCGTVESFNLNSSLLSPQFFGVRK